MSFCKLGRLCSCGVHRHCEILECVWLYVLHVNGLEAVYLCVASFFGAFSETPFLPYDELGEAVVAEEAFSYVPFYAPVDYEPYRG